MQNINRTALMQALAMLGAILEEEGLQCQICLYGGSAMVFLDDLRDMSHDIDYRVLHISRLVAEADCADSSEQAQHPGQFPAGDLLAVFRRAVLQVGRTLDFDISWMNDAVQIFASTHEDYFPQEQEFAHGALKVYAPSVECLLAMKCLALRAGAQDAADIKKLLQLANIQTTQDVLAVLAKYYPSRTLSAEKIAALDEIVQQKREERGSIA